MSDTTPETPPDGQEGVIRYPADHVRLLTGYWVPADAYDDLASQLAQAQADIGWLREMREQTSEQLAQALAECELLREQARNQSIVFDEFHEQAMECDRLCSENESLMRDKARLDWLEATITATGESRFFRSVFLTSDGQNGQKVLIDVKTEDVIQADNIRAAIDASRKESK